MNEWLLYLLGNCVLFIGIRVFMGTKLPPPTSGRAWCGLVIIAVAQILMSISDAR